jgi:hypothetical protein
MATLSIWSYNWLLKQKVMISGHSGEDSWYPLHNVDSGDTRTPESASFWRMRLIMTSSDITWSVQCEAKEVPIYDACRSTRYFENSRRTSVVL